jgi:hypothetical protein
MMWTRSTYEFTDFSEPFGNWIPNMNNTQSIYRFMGCLLLLNFISVCGCTNSGGPSVEGKAVLLSSEPDSPMGIVKLKSALTTGLAPIEAVIVGRVGGGQNETWDPDQAAFLVRDLDLQIESHEHSGDGDNCKFCQAEKAKELEKMALVRVVDESGNVIGVDARQLLGLKENHIIVAAGSGSIDDGTFVFDASKIFIRP